jgi:hypothetical protein
MNILKDRQSEIDISVGVETLKDIPPVLQVNTGSVGENGSVDENETVNMNKGETKTITVTNVAEYDTIEWYLNSASLPFTTGGSLTVNTNNDPFDESGLYSFAVVGIVKGKTGDKRYSKLFHINVGS